MDSSVDLQLLLETGNHPPSITIVAKAAQEQERVKALLNEAYSRGIRVGLNSELKVIRMLIEKNQRNLDATYDFSPLMIKEKVVPPVIIESRNLTQNKNGKILKTTDMIYSIKSQAYFSNTAPNWRSYLNFPVADYALDLTDHVTKATMPKGQEQTKIWRQKTTEGFVEGQRQANLMFEHQMNRLNTDYIGMLKFHQFVLDGRISMPSISSRDLSVTSTGNTISLNQRLLTIKTLPSFDGNVLKWKAWLEPIQIDFSKQNMTINEATND